MKKAITISCMLLSVIIVATNVNALCIDVPKANLRSGPGTSYEIVWEIFKYMPFLKVGTSTSGEWYAVKDIDGDVNWIHKKLVTDKYNCAAVKADEVNVRTGPGTNYSKSPVSPVTQYYSFRILERKGAWVKLKDEWDNIGWIHKDYLWTQ